MPDYENQIHLENYKRDNILYKIKIYQNKDDMYYGQWLCTKNNQAGASNSTKNSKEQVVVDNKINIDAYHFNTFGTKSSG